VLKKLYPNKEDYARRVEQRMTQLITEGWFLSEYADMVRGDVKATTIP